VTAGWPPPIGDANSAVRIAEEIRQRSAAIAEWAATEWSENNFEAKINFGLVSQVPGMGPEAARAVSRDLIALLQRLLEHATDVAVTAKVFGEHMQHLYIDPIEEALRAPATADALKVNK
jgi:hypothetical protein